MLWRHGDVLISTSEAIPAEAQRRATSVLARGEFTGHSHRFATPSSVEIWEAGQQLFVRVLAEKATLIHEEHQPITLPRGLYRVWMQREYTPREIRTVVD